MPPRRGKITVEFVDVVLEPLLDKTEAFGELRQTLLDRIDFCYTLRSLQKLLHSAQHHLHPIRTCRGSSIQDNAISTRKAENGYHSTIVCMHHLLRYAS